MPDKKALVFLRHYNDIDHIVPVLYKWQKLSNTKIRVIVTTQKGYLEDYRLKFIEQFENIRINYIGDFFDNEQRSLFKKEQRYVSTTPNPKYANKKNIELLFDKIYKSTDTGMVVFDWIQPKEFATAVLEEAKKRGYVSVSLPHGDSPYYNLMETIEDLNYDRMERYGFAAKHFDYLVVPNELCARRYNKFLNSEKLKILGSPRFNPEWIEILDTLIEPYQGLEKNKGQLNVLMFLRPKNYSIHWEEVLKSIRLIAQFNNLNLIIKHHTRLNSVYKLIQSIKELDSSTLSSYKVLIDDVHSHALINWADVVLDLGTSASFEAVQLNKPVLAMEYLQANYLTISYYFTNCELKCRDDLYDAMHLFLEHGTEDFYILEERERFINEVIGTGDILSNYVSFLEDCFE